MVERICCVSTWCWCWSRLPKDDWCSTRRRSRKCVHNLSTQQKHTQTYLTFVSSPASLAPVIIFKQNIPQNRWLNLTKWPIDVVLPGSGAQNLSNLARIMRCQRFLCSLFFLHFQCLGGISSNMPVLPISVWFKEPCRSAKAKLFL